MRVKSRRKVEKAYEFTIDVLKKIEKYGLEDKFGMSKWCYKARIQALGRLKKMGITNDMLNTKLESKGLEKYKI